MRCHSHGLRLLPTTTKLRRGSRTGCTLSPWFRALLRALIRKAHKIRAVAASATTKCSVVSEPTKKTGQALACPVYRISGWKFACLTRFSEDHNRLRPIKWLNIAKARTWPHISDAEFIEAAEHTRVACRCGSHPHSKKLQGGLRKKILLFGNDTNLH